MTIALGNPQPDNLPVTLADLMAKAMNDQPPLSGEGIIHHAEGMDLLPSSIALAGTEVSLVNAMSRESMLKLVLNDYRKDYDHILIDCMPSLGMLTINALAASNRVIIPVQANYLSAKGLEQLLQTIAKVRRQINPRLQIDGILLTMVDSRTNNARMISNPASSATPAISCRFLRSSSSSSTYTGVCTPSKVCLSIYIKSRV